MSSVRGSSLTEGKGQGMDFNEIASLSSSWKRKEADTQKSGDGWLIFIDYILYYNL